MPLLKTFGAVFLFFLTLLGYGANSSSANKRHSQVQEKAAKEVSSKNSPRQISYSKGEANSQSITCLEHFTDLYWNTRAELKVSFSTREYMAGFLEGLKSRNSSRKEVSGFDKKISLPSEFTTFEGIDEYLSLVLVELKRSGNLPLCENQKNISTKVLSNEAQSLIGQLKNTPALNPWTHNQKVKTTSKILLDELFDENFIHCSRNFKNHLLNWMSRAFRSNVKKEDFKKEISRSESEFEESGVTPLLKEFALNTFESKALREWDPFFKENHKNIPSQRNLFEILEKIQTSFKEKGHLRDDCSIDISLSPAAQEDLRALRLASLRDDFTALINESVKGDESCTKVVTGNAGESSVTEINSKLSSGTNVQKDYPFFMAYSFLGMACKNWASLTPETMKGFSGDDLKDWQKIHPFKRPVLSGLDSKNDALYKEEFRQPRMPIEELNQVESFKQNGIQNLIYGQSLVYSLAIRETNANPLQASSTPQAEVNKDTGLCHNSATSLGTNVGMSDGSDSLFPYAMDLLKNYVQKARYLSSDQSSLGMTRFKNFCGTSTFEDEFQQKGIKDPQSVLRKVLSSQIFINGKAQKCDEVIDSGIKSYTAGNIASCFRALQMYCPNYGVAHANLVVRAMKRNNGPLSSPSKGLRPACHKVFSDIIEVLGTAKGKRLCELTEDFSIQ